MDNTTNNNSKNLNSETKSIKIKPKFKAQNQYCCASIEVKNNSCCCGGSEKGSTEPITIYDLKDTWIIGEMKTVSGMIPLISSKLDFKDKLGSCKARWGINRMNYKINPGIYATGTPDKEAPILVTANYKLTFDALRKELSDLNVWILVLDTKGINVWCAAGKGTFGTKELVNRINKTKLHEIVSGRTLILPQLGAPGVVAHEVTKLTGFKVIYGTVRAKDIKTYINSGMKATNEMRTVKFTIYNRLVLTPMELVGTLKSSMIIFGILFLLNLFATNQFGFIDFYAYLGALLAGCVVTPVLLPWIPGRAFAWKGWLVGLLWVVAVILLNRWVVEPSYSLIRVLGYLLIFPSVSAFYAMNFTGASTYTSLSGVLKEMKIAIPAIIATISVGVILVLLNCFIY